MTDIAVQAARRVLDLGGEGALACGWLLPVWEANHDRLATLNDVQRVRLVRTVEDAVAAADEATERDWLARIEAAQQRHPRDASLQYLAGKACMNRQLWGKALQLLTQAAAGLPDAKLRSRAWRALAELAEQRGDAEGAARAWKAAAGG